MNLLNLKASPILRLLSQRKKSKPEASAEHAATVDALRRLIGTPEWSTYKRLLDINVSAQVSALLAGATDAEVHRLRGYIQGLLHSVQIPEGIVAKEDNERDRQQRITAASLDRAESAAASLYSTGHWGN